MPTIDQLRMLQALPLDMKIRRTQQRIREWVDYYGVDGVYLSFSGGKDSTVLAHIISKMGLPIQKIFADTGLEYPEIRAFVKSFGDVIMVRPKMRFDEVIRKCGYPIIGKEVAEAIYEGRKALSDGKDTAKLRKMLGTLSTRQEGTPARHNYQKYEPLLHVDFLIGSKCCNVTKKRPMKAYEKETGRFPIMATMAEESVLRQTNWCRSGCNTFESVERPRSAPMSFWTEQDVLAYIKAYNVPIASVYGEVVYEHNGGKYAATLCECGGKLCTTGCQRTGCIFCGFGAHLEKGEGRFERLRRTHPRQYEYCMGGGAYDSDGLWKPTKEGLGMRHVIEELNRLYGRDFIKIKGENA